MNKYFLELLMLVLLITWLLPMKVSSAVTNAEQVRLEELGKLSLEELLEVRISLDDVFDVFDGLVKSQQLKIATGRQQGAAIAPAVTTVITTQDIEAVGARSLDDVLRMVPGLDVVIDGNYVPIYILRGMHTFINPEVLILVNGIPLKEAVTGNRTFWRLSPTIVANIARLEVIRGPGSALYGADAFAGVINIITKTAADIQGTEFGLRSGSYNTTEGWVLHGSQWGNFELATALQYSVTDGLDKIVEDDLQSQQDRDYAAKNPNYKPASLAPGPLHVGGKTLGVQLDLGYDDRWRLHLNYNGLEDREIGLFSTVLDPWGSANPYFLAGDLTWHPPTFTPTWEVTAQLSSALWKNHQIQWMFPPGAVGGTYPQGVIRDFGINSIQWRGELSAFYHGFATHKPRLGIGLARDDLYQHTLRTNQGPGADGKSLPPGGPLVDLSDTPAASFPEIARNNRYVFLQDSWSFTDNWELTSGIRYDDYSDFGSTTNPRLALVWQAHPLLTAKLLYGRAFRAPTFTESYVRAPRLKGYPGLKPESEDSYELAFDYRANENLYFTLNLFHYNIVDKIQAIPIPGTSYSEYRNVGFWKANGLEFEARWKLSHHASVLFNYAYVDNEEDHGDTSGDPLSNALDRLYGAHVHDAGNYPHQMIYLRTDWMFAPQLFFDAQVKWVMDRERPGGDSRPPVADYSAVDLTLRYKGVRDQHWNLAVGVRNLLNEDIRSPSRPFVLYDYPQAGRNWFVEWSYRF